MIVTGPGVVNWMRERCAEIGDGPATGIGWHEKGRLICGVSYTDYNGVNVCMHAVGSPGSRWLRREFLWECFDFPFNRLKVLRVTALVGEGNEAARKFDEHLGFELETTLERAHPTGNLLVYRMFRERCRWISQDFSKRLAKAA